MTGAGKDQPTHLSGQRTDRSGAESAGNNKSKDKSVGKGWIVI